MPIASIKTVVQGFLLVAYLLTCHFAITLNQPQLQLLALLLLSLGVIFRGLVDNSLVSWVLIVMLVAAGVVINYLGLQRYILYLPPVVLPLLMWSVFFRTLLPGHTPLITGIAREVRGSLSPTLCDYTRAVTSLWAGFFLLLAIGSAVLPMIASAHVWSLFTNCLNYLFIAVLFVVEFVYRQWRFRELEHKGFLQYLQSIAHVDVRQFR